MNELQKLIERLEALNTEMRGLLGKAQAEKDEARKKVYMDDYKAKALEFTTVKAEFEEAKALVEAEQFVSGAKGNMPKVETQGKSINPEGQPGSTEVKGKAEVITDEAKEERDRRSAFQRFVLGGKSAMSQADMNMLALGERFNNVEGVDAGDAFIIPKSMAKAIIGRYGAKVMLSTDADVASNSNASKILAPDWRPNMIITPLDVPMIFDYCQTIPAVNGKATWPVLYDSGAGGTDFGGVAFTWKTTEGADKGETGAKFTDFEIQTHELSGWTEVSLTMLRRSSIDLESFIQTLFRNAARKEWSYRILHGTGDASHQPNGLLTYAGIPAINRAVADQVSWADVTNLQYGLTKAHRVNGQFVMEDSVEKYLAQQLDAQDRPLFTPDTANGIRNRLAGSSYQTHEFGPELGTKGDILFGNLLNYWFAVEEDIAIARSDHAAFKQGRVVFRMICFVGGKPVRPSAFTLLDVPAAG